MKKKAENAVMEEPVVIPASMTAITDDFGREDLNRLRDAVNALIARG